jgi:hypothetical protein
MNPTAITFVPTTAIQILATLLCLTGLPDEILIQIICFQLTGLLKKAANHPTHALALLKLLVSYGYKGTSREWEIIAQTAAESGQMYIVKYAVTMGKVDFDHIAAFSGHLHIVKYAVKMGATNFDGIAEYATENGQFAIVKYAVNMGAPNIDWIAETAAESGQGEIFKYAIKLGITLKAWCNSILGATKYGHLEIIKIIGEIRTFNYPVLIRYAVIYGQLAIVDYLVNEINQKNFKYIANLAASYGHYDIVKYAVKDVTTV